MEENLVAKMEEFMTTLDEVKKYREIAVSMTDVAIVFALVIVVALSGYIIDKVSLLFLGVSPLHVFPLPLFNLVIILAGIVISFHKVTQKMRAVEVGEWRSTLQEGAPGAIKLLQDLKWENVFSDIRLAKLGFAIYGVVKTAFYWFIAAIFPFYLLGAFLHSFLHVSTDTTTLTMNLLALVLVLFLSRKDFSQRFRQIGNLDSLLWELRWFDSEFRRADFKT